MQYLRRIVDCILCALAISIAPPAQADEFPSRNVTLMVPFAAGGPGDSMARYFAEKLSAQLQRPVIVENIPGANGMIAARDFIRRPADGHTIFIGSNTTHAANSSLFKELGYDPERDFTPVSCMMRVPQILVVRSSLPIHNLAELLAAAKKQPGQLTYGWATATNKAAAELLKARSGVDLRGVPYKGSPQIPTDMLGGHLDLFVGDPINIVGNLRENGLRALAVTSTHRFPNLPNIPTMREAGIPDYELVGWFSAFLPAHVPSPVAEKVATAISTIARSADYGSFTANLATEPFTCSADELAKLVKNETASWARLATIAGIEKQ